MIVCCNDALPLASSLHCVQNFLTLPTKFIFLNEKIIIFASLIIIIREVRVDLISHIALTTTKQIF